MKSSIRAKFKNHPELQSKLDRIDDIIEGLLKTRIACLINEFAENDQIGCLMTILAFLSGVNVLKYEGARKEEVHLKTPYVCFVCNNITTSNHLTYLLDSDYARMQYQWYMTTRLLDSELILQNISTANYECEYFYLLETSHYMRYTYDRSPFPTQRQRFITNIYEDMETLAVGIVGFYENFYGSEYWNRILNEV